MTKTTTKTFTAVALALAIAACLAFAGCSSAGASSGSSSASSSSEAGADESMLVLGEKTDTALNIVFTNGTDAAITDVAVVAAAQPDAPTFLMEAGGAVQPDEKVSVYVEPTADTLYHAVIVCDGAQYTLHNLNLSDFDEATIRLEGDIAYLETTIDGNAVSSLQEEIDLANQAAEAAAAEAAAAEAAAAAAEEPVVTYDEPAVTYSQPSTGSAPAQSEDACVTDIVLR